MSEFTVLLSEMAEGNANARNKLFMLIREELRAQAGKYMRKERPDHTLQPTALVNAAYVELMESEPTAYASKAHFFHAAALVMRRILVDHSRSHNAKKRGAGRQRMDLDNLDVVEAEDGLNFELLDKAMEELKAMDQRAHEVVMLRYYTGRSNEEVAEILEVSTKTVVRDWKTAQAILKSKMSVSEAKGLGK